MWELIAVFMGAELLAIAVLVVGEMVLPETEARPDPAAMMLGMVLVAAVTGAGALALVLVMVPPMAAALGVPALVGIMMAAVRIPLVEDRAARDRTALVGLGAVAMLATAVVLALV